MSTGDKVEQPYVGQKFESFDAVKKYLEEYGQKNYVKFWIRSSHTRNSLQTKISKIMNPELKYVSMKFACIFGGEKIRCRGSGIRKSSTYRDLNCPCMINAVVGKDGNHVKLDTVILKHNHILCKTLYNSLRKTRPKSLMIKNNKELLNDNGLSDCNDSQLKDNDTGYLIFKDDFQEQQDDIKIKMCNVEDDNDVIMVEQTEQSDFNLSYLQNMQDQYGRNVQILVVNSENSSNEFDDLIKFAKKENNVIENNSKAKKDEICRLCLSSSDQLSPIFNPELPLKSTILSFKIMGCASIEISCDDGLPNYICTTCEAHLDVAYKFRMKCENSDSILRKRWLKKEIIRPPDDLLLKNSTENLCAEPNDEVEEEEEIKFCERSTNCEETTEEENSNPETGNEETNRDFLRPVCGSEQETYESLHMETHSDLNVSTAKEFQVRGTRNDIETSDYSCPHCEMSFATQEDLKSHERSHEKPKSSQTDYLCNFCGKMLKTEERFKCHRNAHEGLRPHLCPNCGRGFADRKNVHHHYNAVHAKNPKLDCPVCRKKFYTRTKMKSHATMHYGVKPFACDACGKTFRLKMNMVKHAKTHSNDRPHKCDKCAAAFIDKNMLERHSYVHGGIRPHACPVCGHRFSVRFHLKKHLEKSKCGLWTETTANE